MKKTLLIFILIIHAVTSTGATLHFHYCCDSFKAVDFCDAENNICQSPYILQYDTASCCENKTLEFEQDGLQFTVRRISDIFPDPALIPRHIEKHKIVRVDKTKFPSLITSYLHKQAIDIYILNCVYRI